MENPVIRFLLVTGLGLLIGAVLGVLLDRLLGSSLFSLPLLKDAFLLEFYIIKIEIQITPASLLGFVVSGYLVIKKG
jgi:predicted membrane chloride channel (bestrophin family)